MARAQGPGGFLAQNAIGVDNHTVIGFRRSRCDRAAKHIADNQFDRTFERIAESRRLRPMSG